MDVLIAIPVFDDGELALQTIRGVVDEFPVRPRILVVDESNHRTDYPKEVEVIRRTRRGKWSFWQDAFKGAKNCDALIQINADVRVRSLYPLTEALAMGYDYIVAEPRFVSRPGWFSNSIARLYADYEKTIQIMGLPLCGGELMAFSKKAIEFALSSSLLANPCPLDDFVVGVVMLAHGMRDCGVECGSVRMPSSFPEYIEYRSRHSSRAVSMAFEYLEEKYGLETKRYARSLQIGYRGAFMLSLIRQPLFVIPFITSLVYGLLRGEDPLLWKRLLTEKDWDGVQLGH